MSCEEVPARRLRRKASPDSSDVVAKLAQLWAEHLLQEPLLGGSQILPPKPRRCRPCEPPAPANLGAEAVELGLADSISDLGSLEPKVEPRVERAQMLLGVL